MIFRKICNDTSTMSATELAHNFVFVKNREAWYRDFDREISVRDLMREICAKHAAPAGVDYSRRSRPLLRTLKAIC